MVSLLSCISTSSIAQFVVNDPSNLAEAVAGNAQALKQWAEEKGLIQMSMDQAGLNTSLEIESLNNGFANLIVRQGATAQEIQNLEVLQDAMPSQDACNAVTTSVNLDNILCDLEAVAEQEVGEHLERMNTLEMTEEGEIDRHAALVVESLMAECRDLTDEGAGTSACFDTQSLLGGSLPAMTEEQARATNAQIAIMVDPIPSRMVNPRQDPELNQRERLVAMRELSLKSMATNSLMKVRSERLSVNGQPSRLQLLNSFADEYFGSAAGADFLAVMTNTHAGKTTDISKQSTPTQVMRSMAVMDAFLVYMEVIKYEQQLRMEALQAGILSATLEPVQ